MTNAPAKATFMQVPMSSPDITQLEKDAVMNVLDTSYLSIGPKIKEFEAITAKFVGVKHAVGVNSGTAGLHLSVIAAGIKEGDEVITPSFSFIASANCVLYERGTPVFVDIDPLTGNMDPAAVEAAITPRTKAMVVVHAFGQPADMDALLAIAKKHNLYVIEDSCEALGSTYKGRSAGTFGNSASFAYYPNKVMTTGEGGMVVTDSDDEAALFNSLRNQGRDVFNEWLQHTRLGYNYRIDELSAALGVAQMQRIEELIARRSQVAAWYNERMDEIQGIYKPHVVATTTRMSWFVYVVRCEEEIQRDTMMKFLTEHGVATRPYFTPIHLQPFYQERFGCREGDLPHTEKAGRTFLALPFSSVMTETMVDYVCEQLRAYVTLRK